MELLDRLRDYFAGDPRIVEKKGFGSVMFLLNGHLVAAARKDGRLIVHVSKADNEAAIAREGASQMEHRSRTMTGFVFVEPYAVEADEDLADWLSLAARHAATLPPK
jgi:hypothetical protein